MKCEKCEHWEAAEDSRYCPMCLEMSKKASMREKDRQNE